MNENRLTINKINLTLDKDNPNEKKFNNFPFLLSNNKEKKDNSSSSTNQHINRNNINVKMVNKGNEEIKLTDLIKIPLNNNISDLNKVEKSLKEKIKCKLSKNTEEEKQSINENKDIEKVNINNKKTKRKKSNNEELNEKTPIRSIFNETKKEIIEKDEEEILNDETSFVYIPPSEKTKIFKDLNTKNISFNSTIDIPAIEEVYDMELEQLQEYKDKLELVKSEEAEEVLEFIKFEIKERKIIIDVKSFFIDNSAEDYLRQIEEDVIFKKQKMKKSIDFNLNDQDENENTQQEQEEDLFSDKKLDFKSPVSLSSHTQSQSQLIYEIDQKDNQLPLIQLRNVIKNNKEIPSKLLEKTLISTHLNSLNDEIKPENNKDMFENENKIFQRK